MIKKIVVAISGASGVHLGVRFVKALPKEIESFVIVSKSAKKVYKAEIGRVFKNSKISP